jgi:hypothetical protein
MAPIGGAFDPDLDALAEQRTPAVPSQRAGLGRLSARRKPATTAGGGLDIWDFGPT